jgi:hypothetical protein
MREKQCVWHIFNIGIYKCEIIIILKEVESEGNIGIIQLL